MKKENIQYLTDRSKPYGKMTKDVRSILSAMRLESIVGIQVRDENLVYSVANNYNHQGTLTIGYDIIPYKLEEAEYFEINIVSIADAANQIDNLIIEKLYNAVQNNEPEDLDLESNETVKTCLRGNFRILIKNINRLLDPRDLVIIAKPSVLQYIPDENVKIAVSEERSSILTFGAISIPITSPVILVIDVIEKVDNSVNINGYIKIVNPQKSFCIMDTHDNLAINYTPARCDEIESNNIFDEDGLFKDEENELFKDKK